MVIVTSHDDGRSHWLVQPVVLDEVLAHVGSLPGASAARERTRHLLQRGYTDAAALLLPQ